MNCLPLLLGTPLLHEGCFLRVELQASLFSQDRTAAEAACGPQAVDKYNANNV